MYAYEFEFNDVFADSNNETNNSDFSKIKNAVAQNEPNYSHLQATKTITSNKSYVKSSSKPIAIRNNGKSSSHSNNPSEGLLPNGRNNENSNFYLDDCLSDNSSLIFNFNNVEDNLSEQRVFVTANVEKRTERATLCSGKSTRAVNIQPRKTFNAQLGLCSIAGGPPEANCNFFKQNTHLHFNRNVNHNSNATCINTSKPTASNCYPNSSNFTFNSVNRNLVLNDQPSTNNPSQAISTISTHRRGNLFDNSLCDSVDMPINCLFDYLQESELPTNHAVNSYDVGGSEEMLNSLHVNSPFASSGYHSKTESQESTNYRVIGLNSSNYSDKCNRDFINNSFNNNFNAASNSSCPTDVNINTNSHYAYQISGSNVFKVEHHGSADVNYSEPRPISKCLFQTAENKTQGHFFSPSDSYTSSPAPNSCKFLFFLQINVLQCYRQEHYLNFN